MFWRLYLSHAAVIATVVGLGGAAVLPMTDWPRLLIVTAVAAATAAFPAWTVRQFFDQPLMKFTAAARRLADGEFDRRVYAGGTPEVRALSLALNDAAAQLGRHTAALEDDRRQLRAILGGLVEGVVSLDADQRIVFVNDRAAELLELPAARIVGRKFWEVVRQRSVLDALAVARAAGGPHRAELEWAGSTPRSLELYIARLPGDAAGDIVVLHDVSELRRLERLRHEFVANVSHELKTPLSVIKAVVETLLAGAVYDAEVCPQFLDQIDDQADRLHALILDLLSLARIESGEEMFDCGRVSLDAAVNECVERLRTRAEAKRLRLEAAVTEPTVVWADEEALQTILDNLVDNAIKYTPEGGRIEVSVGGDGRDAWLKVSDTGIGIPEDDLPRVFERFYRVDKARSRELGGTGLGLSIVKHLAQSMNGGVSARSAVGRGTTFTVRLPCA